MASHAKHLLYAALAPTDAGKRTINIAGIFPEVFVASCLLLFTPPVVKSVYLAFDPLVSYWFDFKTKVVVALPAVFIGAGYVMQALRRAPRRGAIALSLLGPSMALAVQANNIAANALELSNDFAASDCEPFTRKYPLESSWQAASDFQKQCWSKVGEEYLLIHCHDYSEHAFKHPGWAFLENMEHRPDMKMKEHSATVLPGPARLRTGCDLQLHRDLPEHCCACLAWTDHEGEGV
uniref:Uncharacterized protein n=1 Tax=Alexandrium monilatum TaxID=311494 RepID=A0A7S4UPQ1_9DINO